MKIGNSLLRRRAKYNAGTLRLILLIAVLLSSVYFAFATRFDGQIPRDWLPYIPILALIWTFSQCAVLIAFGVHRSLWSFTSIDEMLHLVGIGIVSSVLSSLAISGILTRPLPRSIYLLDAIYSICGIAGARFAFRWAATRLRSRGLGINRNTALIYGADLAGVGILAELKRDCPEYRVLGFLDDRPECQYHSAGGLRVLGRSDEIETLSRQHGIKTIFASSRASLELLQSKLTGTNLDNKIHLRLIESIAVVVRNGGRSGPSEISVEKLLNRPPVQLNLSMIASKVGGRVVMVTGAAGSIGSELCRQLGAFRPSAIVGYEINESALFFIEREMQKRFEGVPFIPCIGSVQNAQRLAEVMEAHSPAIVYHAAAYKHVPLMEKHLFEVIENNIFGTDTLLKCCQRYNVQTFVMISSDKAVRPTSIMGVSKRIAELIVHSSSSLSTHCASVRFGNVLGSNGSVIPIFRKQIEMGGPVTVTHPAMVRYFMTIPEAAQLVLQASSFGSKDEIFVLDMGDPVKIVDLAEQLIRMMGYVPRKEIAIEYSGVRPGEKLFEELSTISEATIPTIHEKIAVLKESLPPSQSLIGDLRQLRVACQSRAAGEAFDILQRLVPEYTPSAEMLATANRRHLAASYKILPVQIAERSEIPIAN